jgi:exonuclease III
MMVEKGLPLDRHPRTQFCLDLAKYITELNDEGHLILLMGDFNEVVGDNPEKNGSCRLGQRTPGFTGRKNWQN